MSTLSDEVVHTLLDQVTTDYNDYLEFCRVYSKEEGGVDNQSFSELEQTMNELNKFMSQLNQLTTNDIPQTSEVVSDTVDYLRKLDHILDLLNNHTQLSEMISLGKKLSKLLHQMCGQDPLEELLCTELTNQLYNLVDKSHLLLDSVASLNSTYVHHLRNEYQGLLQEFQISLKILTDKCLEDPSKSPQLSALLVSILKDNKLK